MPPTRWPSPFATCIRPRRWRARRPRKPRETIMRVGRWMWVSILVALPLSGQVPNLHPQQTFTPEPIVSFSLELAGAGPPYYSISVESTGNAAYRSSPVPGDMEGDPYMPKFVRSEEHTSELQSRSDLVCLRELQKK